MVVCVEGSLRAQLGAASLKPAVIAHEREAIEGLRAQLGAASLKPVDRLAVGATRAQVSAPNWARPH